MKKKLLAVLASGALMLGVVSVSHALTYTYATDVRWDAGTAVSLSDDAGSRYNQTSALGAPNGNTSTNKDFLSLGIGGVVVFDFGVDFKAAAIVFETTGGNRLTYNLETANVFVADSSFSAVFNALTASNGQATITDLSTLTSIGTINNMSFFASIHPPGFHTHSPRHGVLNWFVNVS
jgi:hypothetical protein